MTKELESGYDEGESVLRRWIRELTATPTVAFPGNGQIQTDLAGQLALRGTGHSKKRPHMHWIRNAKIS
ncbi:MAG: hypothetical protein ABF893_01095 [Gluconacetobacter liquefaciens]